jgi:hypothetical protein
MLSERGTVTFGVVHSEDGNGARVFNKNMQTVNEVETPILLSDYKEIEKIMKKINKRLSSLT